ncbi:hypothetical protein GSI_10945 [Ganoderma sinense ZZ0214-1]|uniref:Uncharacterized protein n=1 Tax=Ganoderma sinense ZZ0214-1 TaxID=1077348 RepID=A0A2G8S209_9APHY|nr:hypothetical protein GSI_10945 [Ganoderma sinense ZZ0214-1]
MLEVVHAQDIPSPLTTGTSADTSSPDDWLARDHDVERPVYLILHRPHGAVHEPYRWGLTWTVGGVASNEVPAWRFVQLETLGDPFDDAEEQRYAYFGALTKTVPPGTLAARLFELGTLSLAKRQVLEELAKTVPVFVDAETDVSDPREWVKELLRRLVAAGVLPKGRCDDVLSKVWNA